MSKLKIAVFSDSHGHTAKMVDAVYNEKPDVIIHLGDVLRDTEALSFFEIPIYRVCGNNDFCTVSRELFLTFSGKRLFFCHGHGYNVKSSPEALVSLAKGKGADILLFGHTHAPLCENRGDIFVLNPGSVGYKGSYGIIEIKGKEIKIDVKFI